jgi:hypothetical protein
VNLLVSDPETYAAMVANGDKRKVDYSPENIASAWDDLLLDCSRRRRENGCVDKSRRMICYWLSKLYNRVWIVMRRWHD